MAIRYRCHQCNQLLSIATRMAGRRVACPKCGQETIVPEQVSGDADAAPVPVSGPAPGAGLGDRAAAPTIDFASFAEPAGTSAGTPATGAAPAAATVWGPAPYGGPPRRHPSAEEDDVDPLARSRVEVEEMDLTPMVDMTFLLLIFFMVTASFNIQKIISIPNPDPEKKGAIRAVQSLDDLKQNSVVVHVDERNAITIDDVPLGDPSQLADALGAKRSAEQKNVLLVEADGNANNETIVAVVDAAGDVFDRIRLTVVPGTGGD
jgi:biopolymer transport protein ExbD